VKKNVSQGDCAPIQLCLPGTHDLHFVVNSSKRVCDCSSSISPTTVLRCADAPWACPRERPPLRNTGVHTKLGRAAASEGERFIRKRQRNAK
jgi:hypothetical protein